MIARTSRGHAQGDNIYFELNVMHICFQQDIMELESTSPILILYNWHSLQCLNNSANIFEQIV